MNNENKNNLDSLIQLSAKTLSELIDVNTVVGKPIETAGGARIIPFTKVCVAYFTGGGEYGKAKAIQEDGKMFGGGTGNVITLKPSGFLIDDVSGCRLVKITDEPLDNLMEKAEEMLLRFTHKEE